MSRKCQGANWCTIVPPEGKEMCAIHEQFPQKHSRELPDEWKKRHDAEKRQQDALKKKQEESDQKLKQRTGR